MSAGPSSNEALNFEPGIVDSSADPDEQGNDPERSFNSSGISLDSSQKQENLTDATTSASGEGAPLSKRALKRVR